MLSIVHILTSDPTGALNFQDVSWKCLALLGYQGRPTDQQTDRRSYREVTYSNNNQQLIHCELKFSVHPENLLASSAALRVAIIKQLGQIHTQCEINEQNYIKKTNIVSFIYK